MTILLHPFPTDLVSGLLQPFKLYLRAISHRARLMPSLKNPPEIIFRKHHRIFLLPGMCNHTIQR
jgi:hypothetical protein